MLLDVAKFIFVFNIAKAQSHIDVTLVCTPMINFNRKNSITNGDVVNTYPLQQVQLGGDQNANTSPVFEVIVRLPIHLDISQRMNHVVRSDAT